MWQNTGSSARPSNVLCNRFWALLLNRIQLRHQRDSSCDCFGWFYFGAGVGSDFLEEDVDLFNRCHFLFCIFSTFPTILFFNHVTCELYVTTYVGHEKRSCTQVHPSSISTPNSILLKEGSVASSQQIDFFRCFTEVHSCTGSHHLPERFEVDAPAAQNVWQITEDR